MTGSIAILGATSLVARDLIRQLTARNPGQRFDLFARRPEAVTEWITKHDLSPHCRAWSFNDFGRHDHAAVMNFVGTGDPARVAEMGAEIFEITERFDKLALDYLSSHAACAYLFMSSGAAYGSNFAAPATLDSFSGFQPNKLSASDFYGLSKLYAECRHRAWPDHTIFDIRLFNYITDQHDIETSFFISELFRAIRDNTVFHTSDSVMIRDFIHRNDFASLVTCLLAHPGANMAVDCYSQAPIGKRDLLTAMQSAHGLRYEITPGTFGISPTGSKSHYYSTNHIADSLGYTPTMTSLVGILAETTAIVRGA